MGHNLRLFLALDDCIYSWQPFVKANGQNGSIQSRSKIAPLLMRCLVGVRLLPLGVWFFVHLISNPHRSFALQTHKTIRDKVGSNVARTFTYEITSKNDRKENIILHIEDHIPVSQDKEIEVKLNESSGADINSETGIVKWRVEIPASGQIKKKLGFSIKYPKDKKVNGI